MKAVGVQDLNHQARILHLRFLCHFCLQPEWPPSAMRTPQGLRPAGLRLSSHPPARRPRLGPPRAPRPSKATHSPPAPPPPPPPPAPPPRGFRFPGDAAARYTSPARRRAPCGGRRAAAPQIAVTALTRPLLPRAPVTRGPGARARPRPKVRVGDLDPSSARPASGRRGALRRPVPAAAGASPRLAADLITAAAYPRPRRGPARRATRTGAARRTPPPARRRRRPPPGPRRPGRGRRRAGRRRWRRGRAGGPR